MFANTDTVCIKSIKWTAFKNCGQLTCVGRSAGMRIPLCGRILNKLSIGGVFGACPSNTKLSIKRTCNFKNKAAIIGGLTGGV